MKSKGKGKGKPFGIMVVVKESEESPMEKAYKKAVKSTKKAKGK